ncbi:MAG: 3-phosphoserine/phosphohydroxythreonine transaminase [Phycisphaerae bacterium]|nr:3-phosphoserine/phosphohydroxythreonine transaminase [Phycisphaerae bacterium]
MSTSTSPGTTTTHGGHVDRIFNFSAGPAALPEEIIQKAQQDIWNIHGSGIGILEHSHRGPVFDRVLAEAEEACRRVSGLGDDWEILFIQGGATTQFAMMPMNFLPADGTADYLDTGVWAHKSIAEARHFGNVNVAFDGTQCNYDHVPGSDEINQTEGAAYFHYCSNNTVFGTRFENIPDSDSPLICDTSSEMFGRPFDWDRHCAIYAGAQKNLGPSGVALVLLKKDFAEQGRTDLPSMFCYARHSKAGSRLNTPPTFGIYMMGQVFNWIHEQGGLTEMERRNSEKSSIIYDAIDTSGGFYTGLAQESSRSHMNVSFRLPTEELDDRFVEEAAAEKMDGLKGHRDAGGIRASIYNAFPREGCECLASFMKEFAARNG